MDSEKKISSLRDILPPRAYAHLQLARLDHPTGTFLLLLPTLWGVVFASQGRPTMFWLGLFIVGAIAMRSVGCAINDLADVNFDRQTARTRNRPLADRRLSTHDALMHIGVVLGIAFICFLMLPLLAQKMCIFALVFTLAYPLMKRLTYWPQAFLGISFSLGILVSGAAIAGKITLAQLLLYCSCVIWTLFFDTIYAHQDKHDDARIGVKSTALLLGTWTKPFLIGCSFLQTTLLGAVGALSGAIPLYYFGCSIILLNLLLQIYLVDLDDPQSCANAFQDNQIVGWLILANLLIIFYAH